MSQRRTLIHSHERRRWLRWLASVGAAPVAVQTLAYAAALKGPLISVFTSSQIYRQVVGHDPASARDRAGITAIYADAAPAAQLQLIAALFEHHVTVGVLLSESSSYLERPLRQAAVQAGVELLLERLDPASDVTRALTRLVGAQVLLAVPDSTLYTPDTLRSVLESTYRRGLPVIGFSSATVVAGTLATAYCAIDDVVADLADLLDGWVAQGGGALPEPRFPRYWRVSVNDSVARSLGVPITDKVINLGNLPAGRAG
jgi:putative ABC transport system substrate-binding protein